MARGPDVLEFARRAEAYDHPVDRDRPERAPPRRPAPVPIQPRNPHFEGLLCRAVDQRVLVELRYDDDPAPRLFAPHVVYELTLGRLNVAGTQYENPAQPLDRNEPRIFQIGLIRTLRLTDTYFRPDWRTDPGDPRYRNGILCAV